MNNSRIWLCVLSLMCVVILSVPSTMLAQEQEEPPCCYGPPPTLSGSGTSIETQNLIILLNALIEFSLSQPVIDATGTTTAIVVSDNQIPLMPPKEGFREINSRRDDYLLV